MADTQGRVSSGLRVAVAADNAAYWSISTTMRSDNVAISAVSDALGLGAAKVDVAYAGLNSVIDVLKEFKAKLVAAEEDGVDKAKVQGDLDQLKQQVQSIATSASFSGVNWLSTDIADMYDKTLNRASTVSSFVRDTAGGVSVKTMDVNLSRVALFNSTGGGLLQADPRDLGTLGGLRFPPVSTDWMSTYSDGNKRGSAPFYIDFTFTGPLAFGVGDEISFDVTVDADNPADPIDPPYFPGQTTHVVIDRAIVDAVLPSANGVISTYKEYSAVLRHALAGSGATATTYWKYDPPHQTKIKVDIPDVIGIAYLGNSSLDGSSIEISGFTSTVGSGGLGDAYNVWHPQIRDEARFRAVHGLRGRGRQFQPPRRPRERGLLLVRQGIRQFAAGRRSAQDVFTRPIPPFCGSQDRAASLLSISTFSSSDIPAILRLF
ncbi:flagellin-like hook-associated protein FlgL [Sinorhizobium kostiense]|uniref:Flagellin-like hook-associated protein FlgL n=1 Tax=Sinorhizobium kostiense TaxID=76747 RepID=A0ABS4QXH2_9HYPH|nr:flagellin-like hook-associated protein FlgL [Sinorhizobium kostiense]